MVRQRIVLAEDHPAVAEQVRILLSVAYDVVAVVDDGQALVDAVRRLTPDVIVTDIAMPVMDGIAAARAILNERPDARIVVVTIRNGPMVVRRVLSMGVLGFVVKSDAGDELLNAVSSILDRRPYISTSARVSAGEIRNRDG